MIFDAAAYKNAVGTLISDEAIGDACGHAVEQFPKESCGYVTHGKYHACANHAADPENHFEIVNKRYDTALAKGQVQAVIHSHPHGPIFPSEIDMRQQIATDVPWVIVTLNDAGVSHTIAWGDQLPVAPMIARPFIHGIWDCYSIIRDSYRQGRDQLVKQGIDWPLPPVELPEVPRGNNWWAEDDDLYSQNFEPFGFKPVARSDIQPGDVFLMRLGDAARNPKQRLNHGGVLLGGGLLLHHLPSRISARVPAGPWANKADLWIRHEVAR